MHPYYVRLSERSAAIDGILWHNNILRQKADTVKNSGSWPYGQDEKKINACIPGEEGDATHE